ncbi:MAG: ABC transporter permease subunit [Clostridia bacterium]|nr:ABC transporter permease subunit [Clostridia bacterium]
MLAIYKREMRAYFISPLGYVFLGVYFALTAAIFCFTTLYAMTSELTDYFAAVLFSLVILLPLLTMKLFSEEKKQRTEQLLLTAPVSVFSIVFAKFLAAYTMFGGATLCTGFYFVFLSFFGNVQAGLLLGNLIALLLVGMAFIAVGVFVSSVTETQLSAAILTIGILLGFMLISSFSSYIPVEGIRFVLSALSVFDRFQNFAHGFFDIAGLVYYLSITALFLLLTMRSVDRRRWR